jgi:hypothetical protein
MHSIHVEEFKSFISSSDLYLIGQSSLHSFLLSHVPTPEIRCGLILPQFEA